MVQYTSSAKARVVKNKAKLLLPNHYVLSIYVMGGGGDCHMNYYRLCQVIQTYSQTLQLFQLFIYRSIFAKNRQGNS